MTLYIILIAIVKKISENISEAVMDGNSTWKSIYALLVYCIDFYRNVTTLRLGLCYRKSV